MNDYLQEICKHCGCTFGSHHARVSPWPRNYCPGHEGRMDWKNGPGTIFEFIPKETSLNDKRGNNAGKYENCD